MALECALFASQRRKVLAARKMDDLCEQTGVPASERAFQKCVSFSIRTCVYFILYYVYSTLIGKQTCLLCPAAGADSEGKNTQSVNSRADYYCTSQRTTYWRSKPQRIRDLCQYSRFRSQSVIVVFE